MGSDPPGDGPVAGRVIRRRRGRAAPGTGHKSPASRFARLYPRNIPTPLCQGATPPCCSGQRTTPPVGAVREPPLSPLPNRPRGIAISPSLSACKQIACHLERLLKGLVILSRRRRSVSICTEQTVASPFPPPLHVQWDRHTLHQRNPLVGAKQPHRKPPSQDNPRGGCFALSRIKDLAQLYCVLASTPIVGAVL